MSPSEIPRLRRSSGCNPRCEVSAGWVITDRKAESTIDIERYRKLSRTETTDLKREAETFLAFMRPEARTRTVTLA